MIKLTSDSQVSMYCFALLSFLPMVSAMHFTSMLMCMFSADVLSHLSRFTHAMSAQALRRRPVPKLPSPPTTPRRRG